MRVFKWIFGVAVGGFVLLMLIGSCTPNDGRSKDRDAIRYCWEQQGKKSLDPAAARFAASACERMEDEFRKKYRTSP